MTHKGMCEPFWVDTVERLREIEPRRGGIAFSPGRKPWVKWGKLTSPFRDGTVLTDPHKPIAIIAAMSVELAPLLGKTQSQQVDGLALFELPQAVVVIGGIGEKCARRAAETAIEYAQPRLLLSAGIGGAISPRLKVGDVGRIREVVDVATGDRYSTSGSGWVLATLQDVSDTLQKQELLTKYGADVVDMEGAAVARVAKERGLEFAAVKAISDDSGFAMPPLVRFIGGNGRFDTRRFLVYVALRPKWWATLGKIRKNSNIASANLCQALEHLIEEYSSVLREEKTPLL